MTVPELTEFVLTRLFVCKKNADFPATRRATTSGIPSTEPSSLVYKNPLVTKVSRREENKATYS
jgi:hypothetical protein